MTTETEARDLERRLAYECAEGLISSCCFPRGDGWFDTDMNDDVIGADLLPRALEPSGATVLGH